MDIGEAQHKAVALNQKFREARRREWKPEVIFTDLAEEVGELANAILTTEGFKSEKRKKSEIADSLCDILFDILMLAGHYGIDLSEAYQNVLEDLEKRLKSGEFG